MNTDCNSLNISNDLPYKVRSARFIEYFEAYLSDSLQGLDEEIRAYAHQVALAGGKRIRPLLVYHFAGQGLVSQESTIKASVILELVHLATLIHDDILDGAKVRRNMPATHKEIGSHAAILLGDALFGFALELASQFPTTRICATVAEATRKTCSGEIRQTFARGCRNIELEEYIGFINDKTGELFRASCEIGAYLAGADEPTIKRAGQFGLSLGINYQVFDDLIDAFEKPENSDKCLGSDWGTGKMTLPIILLRNSATPTEIAELDNFFFSPKSWDNEPKMRACLHQLFLKYDVLPACTEYFEQHFSTTNSLIDQFTAPSLRSDLNNFLHSFADKFSKISTLNSSNFLAV